MSAFQFNDWISQWKSAHQNLLLIKMFFYCDVFKGIIEMMTSENPLAFDLLKEKVFNYTDDV